jgi:hypothetical protein
MYQMLMLYAFITDMKRVILIAATLIALLGVGIVLYFAMTKTPGVEVAPGGVLPFGGQSPPIEDVPVVGDTPSLPVTISPRLVKISDGPVVPGEAVTNQRGATASSSADVRVHYIERGSGNVFSYSLASKIVTRTSNQTIPGVQSATWFPNASAALVRYLSGTDFSTLNTYLVSATSTGGTFLPQNLAGVAVSSTTILTLASGTNGSTVSLLRADGSGATTLFSTPLSSVRASFAGRNQYVLFTKPSATIPGYAFLVNGTQFTTLAGPLDGLVALPSPLGKWVLVSYTNDGALQMQLVNTSTHEVLDLPVSTIADKCVWTADESSIYCGVPLTPPNAPYPDSWYQGVVQFTDRIWKIQVGGRYAQLVLDFEKETEEQLDVQALAIDPLATTLVFVNKQTGALWSYSL